MWKYTGKFRPEFAQAPQPGQESVWDYPRPPRCVLDSRQITVRLGEVLIAQTTAAIRVLETASPPTIYIPPSDVCFDSLESAPSQSFCEWKGAATYWSLRTAAGPLKNIGWSYSSPVPSFAAIKDYLSFYPRQVECYIDSQRVRGQDGGFYGGWVTDEIVGPHKGAPGTSGW